MRFHGDPAFPGRQHRTSQLVILPDPADRPDHWLVRGYVLTTEVKDGARPTLYWSGYTTDIVAKVAADWFIKRREIRPWAGEILERFA